MFPEKDYHSFVEFGNRLVSIFPILLSLATATAAMFVRGLPRWVKLTAWGAALGTLAQAPLGLITVRLDLDPVAVMSHFLLAVAVLAAAVVVVLEARRLEVGRADPLVPPWARWAGIGFAALALALIVSGTLVTAADRTPAIPTSSIGSGISTTRSGSTCALRPCSASHSSACSGTCGERR